MTTDSYAPARVADLLLGICGGDSSAWDEIFRRYGRLVTATVRSFRLQEADALDAIQMTWVQLIENAHQVQSPERLGGWLVTTARRECLRILRQAKRDPYLVDAPVDVLSAGPSNVQAWEQRQEVLRVLVDLPPQQRQTMALTLNGYTPAEIAEELNITNVAVRTRLSRARRTFTEYLGPTGDVPRNVVLAQRLDEEPAGDNRRASIPRMTGASSGPPGWHLHHSGPWLVVYGSGPDSEDAGLQVDRQCVARGVDVVLCPIDEVGQGRLDRFSGLVVVLPSPLTGPPAALRPFVHLIMDYRARRPEGLESILSGRCEWFNAGVVQVVGQRTIMRHPALRPALDCVCARHYTDDSGACDVFQPYTTRRLVSAQQLHKEPAGEVCDESIKRLWCDVQAWGVDDMQQVPKLRRCIDDFRNHYENERFSQLYRPIPGLARNRLDIILDGPHDVVIGGRKTWMENGARVCRDVLKELKKIVPGLTRPGGRDSTKDAQKQIGSFYRKLRIIELHTWLG
jgi:RNA polymerase sigma factor (sigma-70 family)